MVCTKMLGHPPSLRRVQTLRDRAKILPRTRGRPHRYFTEEGTTAWTLADDLIHVLAQAGVKRLYGVGDSLSPVTDAMRRSGAID
jgi:hypothetical protein